MMVLTFRDISKFACVNPATEALISDGFVIDLLSFMSKFEDNQSICDEPKSSISLMYIFCAKYFSSHLELN